MRTPLLISLLLASLLWGCQKSAPKASAPAKQNTFPIHWQQQKSIEIEGQEISYRISEYDKWQRIWPRTPQDCNNSTPEEALIGFVSAMRTSDYNWWREAWDQESRDYMQQMDAKLNRTPEQTAQAFLERWQKSFDSSYVMAFVRVDMPPYALIYCANISRKDGQQLSYLRCDLKNHNGRWMVTQDQSRVPFLRDIALRKDDKTGFYLTKYAPTESLDIPVGLSTK